MPKSQEVFFDLEFSMAKRLLRKWTPQALKVGRGIHAKIKDNDFDGASELVNDLSMAYLVDDNLRFLLTLGNTALLYGASRVTSEVRKTSPYLDPNGENRQAVADSARLMGGALAGAEEALRSKMQGLIANLQREYLAMQDQVYKADYPPKTLIDRIAFTITSEGDRSIQAAASIHTSRLRSFGFLHEAASVGITTYRIETIRDERVCGACQLMEGKSFSVTHALEHAMRIMGTSDPAELKSIAPWPSQSKEGLAALGKMSTDDLQGHGLDLPPYHPLCRCIVEKTKDEKSTVSNEVLQSLGNRLARDMLSETQDALAHLFQQYSGDQLAAGVRVTVPEIAAPAPTAPTTPRGGGKPDPRVTSTRRELRSTEEQLGALDDHTMAGGPRDKVLAGLNEERGFNGLPEVLTPEEFVEYKSSHELWRGVAERYQASAGELAEQFRTGELYVGDGIYGSGTYTAKVIPTTDRDFNARLFALDYAAREEKGLLHMKLKPDAVLIDHEELTQTMEMALVEIDDWEHRTLTAMKEAGTAEAAEFRKVQNAARHKSSIYRDPARAATYLGYDGMVVRAGPAQTRPPFIILYNRTAAVVEGI